MKKFDLVVIGAGPSGYAAAMRALDFRKKTLLVEKDKVGGAGVTNGALSSKTWWELSRDVAAFRRNLKKFKLQVPDISYREIQQEVRNAIENLGFEHGLLLLGCGKSVIRLAPPLCITKQEIDEGLEIFEHAITMAETEQGMLETVR